MLREMEGSRETNLLLLRTGLRCSLEETLDSVYIEVHGAGHSRCCGNCVSWARPVPVPRRDYVGLLARKAPQDAQTHTVLTSVHSAIKIDNFNNHFQPAGSASS